MTQPSPSPQAAPPVPGIPTNADGTPNFGSIPGSTPGGNHPVIPVISGTGALDMWSYVLPPELTGTDPATRKQVSIFLGAEGATHPVTEMRGSGVDRSKVNVNEPTSFPAYMTAGEVMSYFQKMAYGETDKWAQINTALADGDFYATIPKYLGSFDDKAQTALAGAMTQYLQATQGGAYTGSFLDFLSFRAQQVTQQNGGPLSGPAAGAGQQSVIPLTDPDTLSMYAQKAAEASLGRALKPGEVQSFINEFHKQQYADATASKGSVVDKNDPRASAIQFVTQNNSQEFGQEQVKGYADAFLNKLMGGGAGALPSPNVDPQAVGY